MEYINGIILNSQVWQKMVLPKPNIPRPDTEKV